MEKNCCRAAARTAADPGLGTFQQSKRSATPRKWQRILQALTEGEVVAGAFEVHCCRYWLSPGSIEKARALMGLPRTSP